MATSRSDPAFKCQLVSFMEDWDPDSAVLKHTKHYLVKPIIITPIRIRMFRSTFEYEFML